MTQPTKTVEEITKSEVRAFFERLGFSFIEIKDSVFREEKSTFVFQTDHKNHTVNASTILYDDAVKIYKQATTYQREHAVDTIKTKTAYNFSFPTIHNPNISILNRDECEQVELSGVEEVVEKLPKYRVWVTPQSGLSEDWFIKKADVANALTQTATKAVEDYKKKHNLK